MIDRRLSMARKVYLLLLFALGELLPFSALAQNAVIKAGHLFNSRTGEFSPDQAILVKAGKIVAVGENLPYDPTDTPQLHDQNLRAFLIVMGLHVKYASGLAQTHLPLIRATCVHVSIRDGGYLP
jgi:hypothetical protein